jgi:hypothetical protein
VGNLMVLL